jgi:energy-coupling factor transporter ATP-binding protein EcfA2
MSILEDIVEWSKSAPAWQADGVRRLFVNQELAQNDIDEVYDLLKSTHGIPDVFGVEAVALKRDHIPIKPQTGSSLKLQRIENVRNVNALAGDLPLEFSESGLTVIYGDNGSGKSGYTRMMKHACRARHKDQRILPNLFLEQAQVGPPEAQFVCNDNGQEVVHSWNGNETPPTELSAIAIFDSHCARAYLDKDDDYAFVPYGHDVFQRLVVLYDELRKKVKNEIENTDTDLTEFRDLSISSTRIAKFIQSLSAQTNVEALEQLATVSQDEVDHHQQLTKSLSEADPQKAALALNQKQQRIDAVRKSLECEYIRFSDKNIEQFKRLQNNSITAKTAANIARKSFTSDEDLLPGTGQEAWAELFESARKFAYISHPNHSFPNLENESPCPLCQQPLDDGLNRLKRFEDYVTSDAEQKSREARAEMGKFFKAQLESVASTLIEPTVLAEINELSTELVLKIEELKEGLVTRHASIPEAAKADDWNLIVPLVLFPKNEFEVISEKLKRDADSLTQSADQQKRQQMEGEKRELDARVLLQARKDRVATKIRNLQYVAKLALCESSLDSGAITRKANQLAKKHICDQLEAAINQEFTELGLSNVNVKLASKGRLGKQVHSLKLNLPQAGKISEVLSEGQQRAIAIGSFLAEVGLQDHEGGIMFDDPVSSLDHNNRDRISKRLVREASNRQVIIFSHDLVFINLLIEYANKDNVEFTAQRVAQSISGFGVPSPDLPFQGKNTKDRIGALKAKYQEIGAAHRAGDIERFQKMTRFAYGELFETWERAVEEVLFQGVVQRFQKPIHTLKLKGVTVTDDDFAAMNEHMTKASNHRHDNAASLGNSVPLPDEFLKDIDAIVEWRKNILDRVKEVIKRRK